MQQWRVFLHADPEHCRGSSQIQALLDKHAVAGRIRRSRVNPKAVVDDLETGVIAPYPGLPGVPMLYTPNPVRSADGTAGRSMWRGSEAYSKIEELIAQWTTAAAAALPRPAPTPVTTRINDGKYAGTNSDVDTRAAEQAARTQALIAQERAEQKKKDDEFLRETEARAVAARMRTATTPVMAGAGVPAPRRETPGTPLAIPRFVESKRGKDPETPLAIPRFVEGKVANPQIVTPPARKPLPPLQTRTPSPEAQDCEGGS